PALPVLAEVVGRNSGDNFRRKVFFQTEDFGMSPDISTVVTDENSRVAHDANSTAFTFFVKRTPLFEEEELDNTTQVELFGEFCLDLGDRFGLTGGEFARPLIPRCRFEAAAEHCEESEVFDPPSIQPTELLKAFPASSIGFGEEV